MVDMKTMTLLVLIGGAALAADEDPPAADDPLRYAGPAREGDQMWLVNTREIKKVSAADPGLAIRRANSEADWEEAELSRLTVEGLAGTRTVVYVHGYDFDAAKAERVGWAMYHELRQRLSSEQRLRMIVWSWPSTAIKYRFVRDVRDKARRANAEAFMLAWLLSRVDTDVVIGSALGCKAVTGSLHLLAGDSQHLNTAVTADARRGKLLVVLISPAIHNDWLLPGEYHGEALGQIRRMLLLNNSQDPTPANYGAISTKSSPVALGLSGLEVDKLGDQAQRLTQVDVAEEIGEEHGVEHYLRSPPIVQRMAEFLFVGGE